MGELVSKGFLSGHSPTRGFYTLEETQIEKFLSSLEAQIGITPLLRVKMDLDGDGIYEYIELDKLNSVGNVSRTIEYVLNRPRFGSSSFEVQNEDGRYNDNNSKGRTYFNPLSPKRYHLKPVIIEIGFDDINKHLEDYWFCIFKGYITNKDNDSESLTASFDLVDEWSYLSKFELAPTIPADDFFDYYELSSEPRQLQLGTYFGKQSFVSQNFDNKDKQLMLPCHINLDGVVRLTPFVNVNQYNLWRPAAYNIDIIKDSFTLDNVDVYFWGYDKSWFTDDKQQWVRLAYQNEGSSNINYEIRSNGDITKIEDAVDFYTKDGVAIRKSIEAYFDTDAPGYDPQVRLAIDLPYANPIKAIYQIVKNMIGVSLSEIDCSDVNPDNWEEINVDYEDIQYFSWDVSSNYMDAQRANICMRIDSATDFLSLLNDVCGLTCGSFFIDKGKGKVNGAPIRRIKYVINQPRLLTSGIKKLSESRLFKPSLERDISSIYNQVKVCNHNSDEGFDDNDEYYFEDAASIAAYDIRFLDLRNKASENVFIYDSANYAQFLAQHYILRFKEPAFKLKFQTDLLGLNWDLKSLIGVKNSFMNIDFTSSDVSGIFEMFSFNFNTNSFNINFDALWAGYLISPDGDPGKRWGFWDNFYYDAGPDGLTYHWF